MPENIADFVHNVFKFISSHRIFFSKDRHIHSCKSGLLAKLLFRLLYFSCTLNCPSSGACTLECCDGLHASVIPRSCTPGRTSQAEQVCGVEATLKFAPWSSRLGFMQCNTTSNTEMPARNLKDNSALGVDGSPAGDRLKLGGESQICLETHKQTAIISTKMNLA